MVGGGAEPRPSSQAGRLRQRGREFTRLLAEGRRDLPGERCAASRTGCHGKGESSLQGRTSVCWNLPFFLFKTMFFRSYQGRCGQKLLPVALPGVDKLKLNRIDAGLVGSSVEKLIPGSGTGCADE